MTLGFDDIVAPMTRADFLDRFWTREMLHQRGEAGRFSSLLTWDGLNDILEHHRLEAPRLRLVHEGQPVDPALYRTGEGGRARLDVGAFSSRVARGAAIVLDQIDEIAPAIGETAEDLAEALGAQVTANLYAGMRASRGFDLHWDDHEVIILQVAGRKQWRVHRPTQPNPLRGGLATPPKPTGPPDWSGVLEDGDMLYLPRGWWHAAEALDGPSLHLTMTIVPPRGVDFLAWLKDELGALARADIPHEADPQRREAYFRDLAVSIAKAGSGDAPSRFLEAWMAHRPVRPRLSLPAAQAALGPSSRLRLASIRVLTFRTAEDADERLFHAAGQSWRCSGGIARALSGLGHQREVTWSDLGANVAPTQRRELARLVTALAVAGVITVMDSGGD